MAAADLGATGYENREELEGEGFAAIQAQDRSDPAGGRAADEPWRCERPNRCPRCCSSPRPRNGGAISVRSFIPHRAHATHRRAGAVSVATACLLEGSPAAEVAVIPDGRRKTLTVEHPTGEMSCVLEVDDAGEVVSAALLRTARKLMDGVVFG